MASIRTYFCHVLLVIEFILNGCCSNETASSACNLAVRKICADPNGDSTLGVFNMTLSSPGAIGGDKVSPKLTAVSVQFRLTPKDFNTDWHNCPAPQFILNMDAAHEVTFTNGNTTVFEKGEIFFCDDVNGSGHRAKAYGGKVRHSVLIEVSDTFDVGPCPYPKTGELMHANDSLPLCEHSLAANMELFDLLSAPARN